MSQDYRIRLQNISKQYKLYDDPADRLKESLFRGKRKYHRTYQALENISFDIGSGETIGVIGRNGSGKSTLLQIISSILQPTTGILETRGRIAALLELGSGFDPEFTGRENVHLNGTVLGLTKGEIHEKFSSIEEFAGIGKYMDQPVKLYSSGMYVRLAFATAINVDPDILLVDEALAVGDIYFQHRCMAKIREIQEQGKTIFFVSHDIGAVSKLCSRAILLDHGQMVVMGKPDEVVQEYYKIVWNGGEQDEIHPLSVDLNHEEPVKGSSENIEYKEITHYDKRFGSKGAEIVGYSLADASGIPVEVFKGGMTLHFSLFVRCHEDVMMPMAGFMLKDLLGNELIKSNSDVADRMLSPCKKGDFVQVTFILSLPVFRSGSYSFSAGFGMGSFDNHQVLDWLDNMVVFTIENTDQSFGLLDVPVRIRQVTL